jgi:hypothetical protein
MTGITGHPSRASFTAPWRQALAEPPVSPVEQEGLFAKSRLATIAESYQYDLTLTQSTGAWSRPRREGAIIAVSRSATANSLWKSGASRSPSTMGAPAATPQRRLLDQIREAPRSRHYSRRAEQGHCHWIERFVLLHKVRRPAEMAEPEVSQERLADAARTKQRPGSKARSCGHVMRSRAVSRLHTDPAHHSLSRIRPVQAPYMG